jgi:hypothetical protein
MVYEIKKYKVGVASSGIMFRPSFVKTASRAESEMTHTCIDIIW